MPSPRRLLTLLLAACAVAPAGHAQADTTAPTIVSVTTLGDGLGQVAGLAIHFSEPVVAMGASAADFATASCACSGRALSTTEGAVQDVRLDFAPEGDTALRPQVRYLPSAGGTRIRDAAGNPLADEAALRAAADGAAPVLVAAESWGVASRDVTLAFSEPVLSAVDPTSRLFVVDFVYSDLAAGGPAQVAGVSHAAGQAVATLTLDVGFRAADENADRLGVAAARVRDAAGNLMGAASRPIGLDRAPPAAVGNLHATGISSTGVRLDWTAPADGRLASYQVRWSVQPLNQTNFDSAAPIPAPAPRSGLAESLVVGGLSPAVEYHFALRAVDVAGNRAAVSNNARAATHADATAPAAAAGFQVVPDSTWGGMAVLQWTAPADDGGGPAAAFELRRSDQPLTEASFAAATPVAVPGPGLPGTLHRQLVQGLPRGAMAHFGLRAVDASGNHGPLQAASVQVPADATPPPGPFTVRAPGLTPSNATSGHTLNLTWDAATDPEGPVHYVYAVKPTANWTLTPLDLRTASANATLAGLADGTWYAHVGAASAGGARQAVLRFRVDNQAPGRILDLAVAAATPSGATLTWTAPADGTSPIASYDILLQEGGFDEGRLAQATRVPDPPAPLPPGGRHEHRLALHGGTTYGLAIRARDEAGNPSALSNVLTLETPADTTAPEAAPAIRSSTHPEGRSSLAADAAFGWDAVLDPESAVAYQVRLDREPGTVLEAGGEAQGEATATFVSLAPGDWYLHVRARSAGGQGPQADYHFVVGGLDPDDVAAANRAVRVRVEREEGGLRVSWTLPGETPAPVLGAQVWRAGDPPQLLASLDASDPSFSTGYLDDSPEAGGSSYLVTLFYGDTAALGRLEPGDAALRGLRATGAAEAGGFPVWGWIAAAALALVGLGGGAWLAFRWWRTRPRGSEGSVPASARPEGQQGSAAPHGEAPLAAWTEASSEPPGAGSLAAAAEAGRGGAAPPAGPP